LILEESCLKVGVLTCSTVEYVVGVAPRIAQRGLGPQPKTNWYLFNAEVAEKSALARRINHPQISPMDADRLSVVWEAAGLS
jgi:hypothetical protein